ncbi:hypothetical protein HK099_006719 [Clydaea vesicula]|uniref:Uncharacterized protein n=1 Tax=Clydaea vesicula TaxID=447962 RepID=A0AAD5Y447_9FUNG|nr:hypothetical protein HK099_006719 [Clydaea vesicula]
MLTHLIKNIKICQNSSDNILKEFDSNKLTEEQEILLKPLKSKKLEENEQELNKLELNASPHDNNDDIPKSETRKLLQKLSVLFFLVLQTSSVSLLLRYSFISTNIQYLKSTTIFFSEIIKFVIATTAVFLKCKGKFKEFGKVFSDDVLDPKQYYVMIIPALIYALQNNLLFIAVSNLDPATFQIIIQSKIITTAVFSFFILNKKFENQKIFALILLMFSVILVQFGPGKSELRDTDNPLIGYFSVLISGKKNLVDLKTLM